MHLSRMMADEHGGHQAQLVKKAEGLKNGDKCPACEEGVIETMPDKAVVCSKCDSSIGLSFITGSLSVVYSEVPEEEWEDNKKKPCTSVCINELETEIHHCELKEGHDGPHRETDYDDRLDAFKVFEWADERTQGEGVGGGSQPG